MNYILSILISTLPLIIFAIYIRKLFLKEFSFNKKHIRTMYLFGILAVFIAMTFNPSEKWFTARLSAQIFANICVGFIEEMGKLGSAWLCVSLIAKREKRTLLRREVLFIGFNVSLTFGVIENTLYSFSSGGSIATAIVRVILSAPGHIAYTLLLCDVYFVCKKIKRMKPLYTAYVMFSLLHATFNILSSMLPLFAIFMYMFDLTIITWQTIHLIETLKYKQYLVFEGTEGEIESGFENPMQLDSNINKSMDFVEGDVPNMAINNTPNNIPTNNQIPIKKSNSKINKQKNNFNSNIQQNYNSQINYINNNNVNNDIPQYINIKDIFRNH